MLSTSATAGPGWRRRLGALALTGGALALAVAGCGGGSGGGGSASNSSGGCNVSIGIMSAFTGDFATAYGLNGANAANLAYKDWKKQHPNCTVKWVRYDSQGDPAQAAGLARKLASDQKIVATLGPTFSSEVQAAMPILNGAGVPAITADSTNPKMAQQGWKYFHRTVVNDAQEGPGEAQYIVQSLHAKRVAVLDDTETYGKGLADIVAAALKKTGAQVVDRESLSANASDYSSTINRIKGSNADAVYLGGLDPTGAPLVKQLRASGSKIPFMGGSGLQTARYLQVGGSAADGSIVGSGGIDPSLSAAGRKWLAEWKSMFHKGTDLYSVEWYNAATALLNAVGAGKTTRQDINAYLGSHPFKGATGATVAFQPDGNVKNAGVNIYKVENGNFKFIKRIATGS